LEFPSEIPTKPSSFLSLLLSILSPYGGWPKRRNHGKHFSNRRLVVGAPALHRYIISSYSEQEHQQRQWVTNNPVPPSGSNSTLWNLFFVFWNFLLKSQLSPLVF